MLIYSLDTNIVSCNNVSRETFPEKYYNLKYKSQAKNGEIVGVEKGVPSP